MEGGGSYRIKLNIYLCMYVYNGIGKYFIIYADPDGGHPPTPPFTAIIPSVDN